MDLKRDLFISEEIISYLQSTYQNIYSDTNIIKNYVRYKELLLKKETAKTNINSPEFSIIFTANDEEELETLNRYFYGNSDGSNSGDGNSLAYTYLSTIDTIKELINKSDNSIKDVVTNLTALLDNPSMSDEAYKKYLNELIIPGILGTSEITSEKTSNTISTGSTIENEFSKTKKDEYKTELVAEQNKRMEIDQKIKLDKETNERTLLEEKQKKLNAETTLRTAKIEAKDQLIAKNKQTQKEEKKEIILNKIDIIDEDINVKLETINDIIKKKIYEKSIINYFKAKGEDDVDDDGKEEEEDKKKDKEKKPALYAGSDEKKIKEIGLLQVKLNKQLTLMKEYTFQLKIELKFPSFMKHLYEFLLSEDKRTPISEDKRKDLLKKIEECDKQIEEIKKIESDSSYILKISNENIKTLLFFISFDSLYINKISNQIDKLKKEIQKKTGGGNKKYPPMLKNIYKNLNKTSDYKIDTKIEKKTDKLLLSYIRLYNLYIQPIKLQLKTLKEQSETKDKDNLPKDLLLLYDNFKKEYNDFIKENKEILEPEEDIKKITDKLAKKTSQKKIETDIIKIEIVALFDQYEQLAINYKNSEKYTKPITLKGGKNIKVEKTNSDLNLIKKTLEGYLEKIEKIEESEKPAKNDEMITKINKILLLITIFNNNIGDTVNDATNVMSNIISNISRKEEYVGGSMFTSLFRNAKKTVDETLAKIHVTVKDLSDKVTKISNKIDGTASTVDSTVGEDDNLVIVKEHEYYAEYSEIFKAAKNYNKNNLNKDEYVRIKNKYLDEIIDSFYQIQEYYNDFFATRLKKEVDELLEEVKKIILKFKTLKYLNKYDKNILEFKEKLDKLKKKLKEYSDLNYDENNDLIDDTEDINEDPSINVINKKIASKQKEKEEKEIQKKTKEQEIINVQKEKKTYQEALDKNILADQTKVYTAQQLSEIKAKNIEKTTEIDALKGELSTLNTEIKAKNDELQELEQEKADKKKDLRKNKKQEDIKKQGNDKNIEKNKEFISKITKQYEEYEKIISNYEKTIAIIRIIKKKLNKIIYDKISDKETFKYIKKKYIKCYIDYYLYLIIQKYILKLEKLEKLTPTQDEKFIQNIETTYDKEIDDYKEAFYKSINEIITSDNNKLYDLLKSFFNEKLSKLLTTDEKYDRFDDYQIYLIINLMIKLNNTEKNEALKSIAYDILFNSTSETAGIKNDGDHDAISGREGYDNISNLNHEYTLNDKILPNIKYNINIDIDISDLIKAIYKMFLDIKNSQLSLSAQSAQSVKPSEQESYPNRLVSINDTSRFDGMRNQIYVHQENQTGGNNNIIDIKKTYDLYYTTNSESLIIEELLEILKTSENVIYFLLIINTSLSQLFKDLRKMLINFYEIDILLSYYYDENEIIYYIFLNYIYANYKSLLNLSKKDIIINIGKIKTRENYGDIYNKLEELFKNREIMEKLILFIKSHLIIPKSIIHPIKTKDTEYLLLYIYKYSKKEEKTIKGYDSFLTFVYLNLLNKFNNKIDDLPTFNLYNFSNLKKSYYNFELSSYQHQLSTKLMKDVKLLIAIISERYKYIEHKKDIRPIFEFTINDEILDYLNIFGNDELFRNYKEMSIMDLYTLNKNVKINIEDIKEPNKQDNIIFNIILLSSYIFKDDNIIPVEIYCKLVKHYFLTKNTKILNDLVYAMIVIMNRRINKSDIHRKLIKELSIFNIDLSEIKIFINPENKKINIIELLEKINFSNYIKSDIRLIIPFLYHFYKTDNKLQYTIEDLLCKQLLTEKQDKLIMYGGATSITSANSTNPSEQTKSDQIIYNKAIDLINEMFSNKTINEIENQIKKIDNEFKEIPKLEDLDNEFNKAISMDVLIETKSHKFTIYSDYVSESKFDNLSRELIKHCTDKDQITTPHSPESMKYKSLLNSKLIDIEKFKTKLEEVHRKKFEEKKTEIIRLYEPFENLINKIKSQPEIHDYPYIKEIYKQFIKNDDKILDEKQKEIKYDINKYFDDYSSKVLDVYKSMIKDIIDDRQGKLPNLIKNLDDIITNNKQQKYKNKDQYPNPYIGGNKYENKNENKIYKGGKRSLENYDVLVEDFNKRIIEKDKKLVNMYKNLKRLKGNREIDSNVEKKLATPDFYDNDGNNIFERLIATYDKDINDKNMPIEITNSLFYDKVKNHNLDPEEELEITLNDKLIFIVLVYCIRVGSLLFCYYLINNNLITDINKSLFYYLIFYYAIFVLILLLINIDTFKMRILVNYMNLHVSTTNIWMHLILMGSFIYLIYLLIVNILGEEKPPTELGDHEKIKLKYKLDLLTIIIYTFIIILIFII